ncbi:hypothetical protein MMC28_010617 [Mycoblastus sanguinarius]|nr:hypothetical protein [Mycoblastus sanguinarius]
MAEPARENPFTYEVLKQDLQLAFQKVIENFDYHIAQSPGIPPGSIDERWVGTQVINYMPRNGFSLEPPVTFTKHPLVPARAAGSSPSKPVETFSVHLASSPSIGLSPSEKMNETSGALVPAHPAGFDTREPSDCTSKGSMLLILPREISDIIYGILVCTGNIEILRACKELNREVMKLLFKQGICRLKIKSRHRTLFNEELGPTMCLSIDVAHLIQNLSISINVQECFRWSVEFAREFGCNSITTREHCRIIFQTDCHSLRRLHDTDSKQLEMFKPFKTVTLEIEYDVDFNPHDRRRDTNLQYVRRLVEPVLGQATLNEYSHESPYTKVQYLRFHPGSGLPRKRRSYENLSNPYF